MFCWPGRSGSSKLRSPFWSQRSLMLSFSALLAIVECCLFIQRKQNHRPPPVLPGPKHPFLAWLVEGKVAWRALFFKPHCHRVNSPLFAVFAVVTKEQHGYFFPLQKQIALSKRQTTQLGIRWNCSKRYNYFPLAQSSTHPGSPRPSINWGSR